MTGAPRQCETCDHHVKDNGFNCCKIIEGFLEGDEYTLISEVGCASHSSAKSSDKVLHHMSQLCAYLHYSHGENERMAKETKNRIAREILKGRMFEDCMILEALEELRVKGKIELRTKERS